VRRSTLVLAASTLALTLPRAATSAQQRAVTLAEALELAEKAAPRVVQATGNAGAAGSGFRRRHRSRTELEPVVIGRLGLLRALAGQVYSGTHIGMRACR
jgi:hypothetical protein